MDLATIRRTLRALAAADLARDEHTRVGCWFALRAAGIPSERLEWMVDTQARVLRTCAARPAALLLVAA